MKNQKLTAILAICLSLILPACGGSEPYYRYTDAGESNLNVVNAKCQAAAYRGARAPQPSASSTTSTDCSPDGVGGFSCTESSGGFAGGFSSGYALGAAIAAKRQIFRACAAELGWLPCSQGGQGRPECTAAPRSTETTSTETTQKSCTEGCDQ